MNIGKEPQTSINESNGVSILKLRLQQNGLIKCYFSEGDKTPNTDGFFVVNNEYYPLKEFHVQIKTVDLLSETKGSKVYQCDTKFINYINLEVTENPSFIFVIELQTKSIYFKYLSEKFLKDNNFIHDDQETVALHFTSNEILTDIEVFYRLVCDIIKFRKIKSFTPAEVDMLEYQIAFDMLNDFFDKDFNRIKTLLYPSIWKFGIAYQRTPFNDSQYQSMVKARADMGIEMAPYVTTFGAYAIEYGDKQQIFQNVNIYEDENHLKLLHHISSTNGIPSPVEDAALRWLSNVFETWIQNEFIFIPFVPNEALFEIVYNFLDKNAFEASRGKNNETLIGNTISTKKAKHLIAEKYPLQEYVDKDIVVLLHAINEIERRRINRIKRVWVFEPSPTKHIRNIYYYDAAPIIKHTRKLFINMPKYYNEFITRLFGENKAKKFVQEGNFKFKLDINFLGSYFKNEYYSTCIDSDSFKVDIVNELPLNTLNHSCGMLHTSFKGDKTNILTNILSILYRQVCKNYNFKQSHLFIGRANF